MGHLLKNLIGFDGVPVLRILGGGGGKVIRPSGEEQSSELFGNWYGPVDSEEGLPAVCLISVFTPGTSWQ